VIQEGPPAGNTESAHLHVANAKDSVVQTIQSLVMMTRMIENSKTMRYLFSNWKVLGYLEIGFSINVTNDARNFPLSLDGFWWIFSMLYCIRLSPPYTSEKNSVAICGGLTPLLDYLRAVQSRLLHEHVCHNFL
jgi:hypothetical protein